MESLDQSLLVACSATVMLTLGLGNSSLYTERGEGHAAHITPDYTTLVTSDRLSTLSVERERGACDTRPSTLSLLRSALKSFN